MFRLVLSLLGCMVLAASVAARPLIHCTSAGSTFTASVIWTGATEELPFVTTFYANTGECVTITCANPNGGGDLWVTGPAGLSSRALNTNPLVKEFDLGTVGDEGWHTIQLFTSSNATENFSCTCTRTAGGC